MRLIYCAGELGRVVVDILRRSDHDDDVVFIDDDETKWGETIAGFEVIGGADMFEELDEADTEAIVAFADRQTLRLDLGETVRDAGFDFFSAVDTDATIAASATIGSGVIVNAQSYVGPDAEIGDLVVIDSAVSVSHDVYLERGVTLGPNATIAGGVTVGRDVFVGAGATIIDDVSIGDSAVVGAGAVVTSDVKPDTTVIGVPARQIDS